MNRARAVRILSLVNQRNKDKGLTSHLCDVSTEVTETSGAGIMLMAKQSPTGSLSTSNEVSARLERLQYELGEGPCIDAFNLGLPVLEPNLSHPKRTRWIGFSGPALEVGARAVFGFPLTVANIRFGTLNLYRDSPGELGYDNFANALVVAEIVAKTVFGLQTEAPIGQLASDLEEKSNFHLVVHQAAGMVSAQLDISIHESLGRLRGYAFGHGRNLDDVAHDVVSRRLRFTQPLDPNDLK